MKTVKEIDFLELEKLKNKANTLLIDVREREEYTTHNIGGYNMPAHLLNENLKELQNYKNLIIVCSNGMRSHIMARVIQKKIPSANIFHLTEGIIS